VEPRRPRDHPRRHRDPDPDQETNRGLVAYTLTAEDLSDPTVPGTYEAEWQVTIGGTVVTWPCPGKDTLRISAEVG
jgi:hypothetical protein